MQPPLPAVIPIDSSIIKVQNKDHPQDISIDIHNLRSNIDDLREITSAVSNGKKQKVPDSMKKFLIQRKFLREGQSNPQQPEKISFDSKKKILNESSMHLRELQNQSENKKVNFEVSNPSHDQIIHKMQPSRPVSRSESISVNICPICEGQVTERNLVKTFTCRHIYCEECARSYIKFKINLFEEVSCPEESCSSILNTDSQFYKNLTKRQRRIYSKINSFYTTQEDTSKKLCPKQQCQGIITLINENPTQQCPLCKTKFCSNCFLEAHSGQCREYEVKFIEDNLHYRQCAKCHIVVERTDGCNHITCKCGYQFCYICGGVWKHEHICISQNLEDSGCDWGQNWQDHFLFLVKLPLKFILTTLYTTFWFAVSFAAAPYNLFFFIYWILLIFVGGPSQFIFEGERPIWQIFLLFLVFPLLMIYCLPRGIRIFLNRFLDQCPYVSDGYRCIIGI